LKIIPKYDEYDLIGRTRLDAVIALANCDPTLIARGLVDGVFAVNKFGGGFEAAADVESAVWDGGVAQPVYSWPTTATITHIRQATDQVGTDGGATIELQGLDANWDLVVQTKDLDGSDTTAEVALDTPLIRIFRKKVLANVVLSADVWSGATGVAANTAKSIITAGHNQTLMAIYTVPRGKVALMEGFYANVVNETAANKTPVGTEIKMWAADRDNGYEFQLKFATAIAESGGNEHHHFHPPYKFAQKTDIMLTMRCIKEPGHVHAGFDLAVFDN